MCRISLLRKDLDLFLGVLFFAPEFRTNKLVCFHTMVRKCEQRLESAEWNQSSNYCQFLLGKCSSSVRNSGVILMYDHPLFLNWLVIDKIPDEASGEDGTTILFYFSLSFDIIILVADIQGNEFRKSWERF